MIRRLALTLIAVVIGFSADAQQCVIPLEKWDYTAYISVTKVHPMQLVTADNNWQLLWEFRKKQTIAALKDKGIACTQSQLFLLQDAEMIVRTKEGLWNTRIPILDSIQTTALRIEASIAAENIYPDIEGDLHNFISQLDKQGFHNNAFAILFSYILDGTIWEEFERQKVLSKLPAHPGWEGYLWFCYPKPSGLNPGTNTIPLDDHYTLNICHADNEPDFSKRIYDHKAIQMLAAALRNKRSVPGADDKTCEELGFLLDNRLAIPIIRRSNALGQNARKLTRQLCDSFLRQTNSTQIKTLIKIEDTSLATIIFYHEVLWQLSRILTQKGVVEQPNIFVIPEQAKLHDTAATCFITRN